MKKCPRGYKFFDRATRREYEFGKLYWLDDQWSSKSAAYSFDLGGLLARQTTEAVNQLAVRRKSAASELVRGRAARLRPGWRPGMRHRDDAVLLGADDAYASPRPPGSIGLPMESDVGDPPCCSAVVSCGIWPMWRIPTGCAFEPALG